MNTTFTAFAVLASLLLIFTKCESAVDPMLLENDCALTSSSNEVGPWTALLHENDKVFCAGTLITKRFILTAAQCVRVNTTVLVRLGEFGRYYNDFPEDHKVELSLRYRFFDSNSDGNDIALLKLTKDVVFKNYIKPVCINRNPNQRPLGEYFVGYAWTDNRDEYYTANLTTITIGMYHEVRRQCDQFDIYTQFCAGPVNKQESCDGMAGSALIKLMEDSSQPSRAFQFGISTSDAMDCQGTQGYTNVTKFYSWIQDNVILFERSGYKPKKSFIASDYIKVY
ncbi:phenoloxidase-activating factor 1 [Drosophila elegans]|uniref:phenoloxidase-activating factor 1 n=1 Tax=Drosophila elegans TaxID=30023 RepID=UPI0007E7B155|nr:phenoloxidase-activating factor 1 [Drosophila elegans]